MKKNINSKKNDSKPFFFKKKSKKIKEELEEQENVREVIVERDNGFNTIEVIVIILISILFGVVVGCVLSSTRTFGTIVSDEVNEIVSTYDAILENYYEEIDASELANAAVSGMISILDDPYSVYMNSDDTDSFLESVNGSFVGIGVTVLWSDDCFKIVDIIDGSPAFDEGLKKDDVIIEVGSKDVTGLNIDELSSLIKGKSGSKVNITVLRGEEKLKFTVKRKVVEIPSVSSEVYDNSIGYISIDSFSATTSDQFSKKLDELEKQNINSLIIDVRDNPGGKLGQVNKVLDLFMSKKTVLYKIETKGKTTEVYASDTDKKDIPVVILVNHESASAAEILAASFQDNYKKATIVGSVTYGKGTIQKAVELSSGASIKYTTQKWLTPKGKWINEKGIIPDETVSQSDEYLLNPVFDNDLQLQKAIEVLKK